MLSRAALALLLVGSGSDSASVLLPAPLASYRSWHPLEASARAVSLPLSMLCISLPKEQIEGARAEAQKAYGPHAERFVRVYANPVALAAIRSGATEFPVGAVVAKEKLLQPDAAHVDGIAFMIKHSSGSFVTSGGWEFAYYPQPRNATFGACVDCHRTGNSVDYVFTRAAK